MIQIKIPPPDDAYVRTVCKVGQGNACCRYLTMAPTGWSCAKSEDKLRQHLDERVRNNTIVAQGDNCPGRGAR